MILLNHTIVRACDKQRSAEFLAHLLGLVVGGWDRAVHRLGGGRRVYVRDPDGHSYELFTAEP